jgi:hypothetical protein
MGGFLNLDVRGERAIAGLTPRGPLVRDVS